MIMTSRKVKIFLGRQARYIIVLALWLLGSFATQAAASNALLHNSDNLGTKYGTWGVAGGKYGQFTCTTCHNKTTDNIKRVAGTITAPLGNWSSSNSENVTIVFNNMTGFGNDTAAHTTSTQVCQVCHSKTDVHRYNKPVGQTDSNHKGANGTDCTGCHSHADAFKGKGCTNCHGSSAASTNPITTGQHTVHIADAVYGCVDCHAKSVTDDSTFKAAPTAHGNTYYGDYSGLRAGGSYADGNCANVYCHTDGKGGVPATAVNWNTGPSIGCKGCHGVDGTYGEPGYVVGNSHAKHVNSAADCVECHYATTADGTTIKAGGDHTNQFIDVDGSSNIGFNNGAKTCSSASCHANPYGTNSVTTPAWGTSVGCAACHTGVYVITLNGPATGSHTNVAGHAVACIICHAGGTAADTKPSSGHVDGNIDVANVGYATLDKTKGTAGTTCSTATCHANVYGAGTVTTPVWGATAGCEACHTTAIGVNGPATGSHTIHAGQLCTNCHAAGTSATTSPSTGHADGDIDTAVGSYPTNITKHAAGSGYSAASCSTNTCHGGATMTWGANTTDASCTKCHGKGTVLANYSTTNAWQAAPGYATTGTDINGQTGSFTNGVSNDAQVGAHDAHLRTINGYSDRKILCTDCHAIPGTANHANGATDYAWSNLAKNIGTTTSDRGALNPGYGTGTCSANYCHGGALNGGSDTTPVWNDTTYLAAYSKDATTCGKCHGSPPTSGATLDYDHNGYTIASTCTGCHGHEGSGANHIDGNLQATGGACNACHSYDTVGGVWGSGTRMDGGVAEGWGAHARHIDHLKTLRGITLDASTDTYGSATFNAVCGVCHERHPSYHTLDNSSARMINISSAYQTGASAPSYLGVSGTSSSVNPKTCSNIACHFNVTPRWQ